MTTAAFDPDDSAAVQLTPSSASLGGDTPVPPEDGTGVFPPVPRPVPARVADIAANLPTFPASETAADAPPTIPGYEVLGLLGRGGMGVVYQARHLPLRRTVALKMIRSGSGAGAEELARFRAETEAVAALQHPGIVQIYEVGEHLGRPYCALEYVPSGSLAQRAAGQPQPAADTARLVEALARAIQCAHEAGIVHRDLKPGNVLLAADGTPKVTDFGLAKRLEVEGSHTRTGQLLGTPCYMAPELLAGQVGPAADLYALGAILYELLTGRPPFHGVTAADTLHQTQTQDPVPPRRLQSGVPRDLETICLTCLRKEPHRRYATAAELADDLHRFQAGEPIRARPTSVWEHGVKWAKRRPATATLVATSALALVGLVGGGLWYNAQLRTARNDLGRALGQVTVERDQANQARDRAKAESERAQANLLRTARLGDRITELVATHFRGVPGTAAIRREVLEEVAQIHAECRQQAGDHPAVEQLRGRTLQRLGLIYDALENPTKAEELLREGVAIAARLQDKHPDDPGYLKDRAYAHHNLAANLHDRAVVQQGRTRTITDPAKLAEVEDHTRAAARLQQALIAQQPDEPGQRVDLAKHLNNLGGVLRDLGRYAEAEQAHAEAVAQATPVVEAHPRRHSYRAVLARNYSDRGGLFQALAPTKPVDLPGRLVRGVSLLRAEEYYRRSAEEWRAIVAAPSHPLNARPNLAVNLDHLAYVLEARGRLDQAEAVLGDVLKQRQKQVDEFPTVPRYQTDLAGALNNLANLLTERGHPAKAIPLLRQAIRYQEAVYRLNTGDAYVRTFLRNHHGALTEAFVALGDHVAAATAAEQLVRVNPKHPSDPYHAARYMARCIGLAAADPSLDTAERRAKQTAYADQAMKYLTQARKNGFRNTPGYIPRQAGQPLKHPDLKPLEGRPEFQRLVADLTAEAAKEGK